MSIRLDRVRIFTYINDMQTVSELNTFRKSALSADMSDDEITALITELAKNPDAGDEIAGTGGCRKLRFALKSNTRVRAAARVS